MIPLAVLEEIIDASGAAPRIEAMLPTGVRPRQLSVRTLLAGMSLAQADHRPAHLTRVHQALTRLPGDDQRRLGIVADWTNGPHQLTCRQTERTFGLLTGALAKDEPDGQPSPALQAACDDLLEASTPSGFKDASRSLAVDWTDLESFSRPPPAKGGDCADPEASWGHRRNNRPGDRDELFFGYYFSAGIMMPGENGPAVPEFARRFTLSSCRHDPVRALVPVLTAMPAAGIPLGDVLADSGYAHRDAEAWALPLRAACPAATSKIRCPLRPSSMTLDRDRPEILQPPQHPQQCCTQQTITVPPDVLAKTAQKHDYPSAAHRRSYTRRTGAERGFATAKDPASNDISRGWCRLMGLTPLMLFTATLLVVRNQRILQAWNARQEENERRAAKGLPPRTRRRRRNTLTAPAATRPP